MEVEQPFLILNSSLLAQHDAGAVSKRNTTRFLQTRHKNCPDVYNIEIIDRLVQIIILPVLEEFVKFSQ